MAASIDIKIFSNGAGRNTGIGYYYAITPVITVTTTGDTQCDNSKLVVTYSGTNISGSETSTVTVGQNTTKQIYNNNKRSNGAKNDFSGSCTVKVSLETSSGTVTKSRTFTFSSVFSAYEMLDSLPLIDDEWTGSRTNPVLGELKMVVNNITDPDNTGYSAQLCIEAFRVNSAIGTSIKESVDIYPGVKWEPSLERYAPLFTNSDGSDNSVYLNTYYRFINIDGSIARSSYKGVTVFLTLSSSIRPTITSVTPSDTDGYRATYGVYVGTKSILQASVEASGIYGSTITKVAHQIDELSVNTTDPTITKLIGRLNQAGSRTLKTTVTDSRGRTAVRNTAITVVPYISPSLSFSADRWDTANNEVDDGSDTVRLLADGTIPSINNVAVSGTLLIEQRQKGATAWTTAGTYDVTGPSVTEQVLVASQSVDNRYEYRATLTDMFGTSVLTSSSVGLATPVLEFHGSGKGAGIGIVAPETGLNIGMQTDFRGTTDDGFSRIRIVNPEGTKAIALAKLAGSELELLAPSSPVTDYDRAFINSHVFMRNNLALGWFTSDDAQTDVLRLNKSNQVEFNWTSGGLRGRVMKLLWSGTLSSGGRVTIADLPYYNVFGIAKSGAIGIGFKNAGVISGVTIHLTGNTTANHNMCLFQLGASGTTLSYKFGVLLSPTSNNYVSNQTVDGLFGIL